MDWVVSLTRRERTTELLKRRGGQRIGLREVGQATAVLASIGPNGEVTPEEELESCNPLHELRRIRERRILEQYRRATERFGERAQPQLDLVQLVAVGRDAGTVGCGHRRLQ